MLAPQILNSKQSTFLPPCICFFCLILFRQKISQTSVVVSQGPDNVIFFSILDTMVSNDPWSPLAGGQDTSTVLGGTDAWGAPAATGDFF